MEFTLLFWLLLFLLLFSYCIRSEILGQDCIKTCINQAPDALDTDTPEELKVKISKGARTIYQTVEWRKALCLAFLTVLFVFLMGYYLGWKKMPWRKYSLDRRLPRGIDVFIPVLVLFILLYVVFSWMQEKFWKPIALKIRTITEDI